jgi:hypothetical protein
VVGVAPVWFGELDMNKATKVIYYSMGQEERPRQRHYQKDWPIIIVLTILFGAVSVLFGAVSVLLGLWQAPVPTLISAL